MFRSLEAVEQKLGKEPTGSGYNANGEFSDEPFRRRFGSWPNALAHYRKWKAEHGADVIAVAPTPNPTEFSPPDSQMNNGAIMPARLSNPARPLQLYGEPIDFRGLRHAPINEQGVVYLFGMVSRELGFYIEAVQQGFPDCEGKYLHEKKTNLWAKARIEFEFKSSNFLTHGHDPNSCDFIVCWEHDWPDCPLRVLELKQEILKLPST